MRALAGLLLLAGCFSPDIPVGLACSESKLCPSGQSCRSGVCELTISSAPSDAQVAPDAIVAPVFACTWRKVDFPQAALGSTRISGLWGAGPSEVYAVSTRVARWDGGTWVAATTTDAAWKDVWGSGPGDVWVVGAAGAMLHLNGGTWQPVTVGTTDLRAIWGSGPTDIWAVAGTTTSPSVIHLDDSRQWGSSAELRPLGVTNLAGLWGSGPDRYFAVGAARAILHGSRTTWSSVNGGGVEALQAVWGSSATNVWAAGTGGLLMHYDGRSWSAVASGTAQPLSDLGGTGPGDVWAVGGEGTILHYDGMRWSKAESGTNGLLNVVWASGPTDVWAAGASLLLRCTP